MGLGLVRFVPLPARYFFYVDIHLSIPNAEDE